MHKDTNLKDFINELSKSIDFDIPEICIEGVIKNYLLLQEYSRFIHQFTPTDFE